MWLFLFLRIFMETHSARTCLAALRTKPTVNYNPVLGAESLRQRLPVRAWEPAMAGCSKLVTLKLLVRGRTCWPPRKLCRILLRFYPQTLDYACL